MVHREDLGKMRCADITKTDPETLPDLLEVSFYGKTSAERMESCLSQMQNPYCFRVGKTPVKITFSQVEISLEEKLKRYFLKLKG